MQHITSFPDTFRLRGSLYGLILGDIIGSYFEFTAPSSRSYPDLNALKHGLNVFKARFGYTDDTILTLHSMEAYIDSAGMYRPLLHVCAWHQYLEGSSPWSPTGTCFDIGLSTRRSLQEPAWVGKDAPKHSGNGVLMKLLPFAWHMACDPRGIINPDEFLESIARITHGSHDTVRTAQIMGKVLARLLQGVSWKVARACIKDSYPAQHALDTDRRFSGYCDDSLTLAFHLMDHSYDWQEAIRTILSLGGDTDTNAAIFGQLYGAAYPDEMARLYLPHRCDIHRADDIEQLTDSFLAAFEEATPIRARGFRTHQLDSRWRARKTTAETVEARNEGQHYILDCPRDCAHYAEGCMLGHPVRQMAHMRRMNSIYRERIRTVRSDAFRSSWQETLGRCPPNGAAPCYHTNTESSECTASCCWHVGKGQLMPRAKGWATLL